MPTVSKPQDRKPPTAAKKVAAKPKADRYAVTTWGKSVEEDLECPSGQTCRVRQLDLAELVVSGKIDGIDTISKVVSGEIVAPKTGKGKPATAVEEAGIDILKMDGFAEIFHLMDEIVAHCVIIPSVAVPPENFEDRVEGQIYTDQIDLGDKTFIFEWAFKGMEGLAQFRP